MDQPLAIGGGFQQSINAVLQITRIRPPWLTLEVFTTIDANAAHPALNGVDLRVVRRGITDDLRQLILSRGLPGSVSRALARHGIVTALEQAMHARHVDLAYFVSPSRHALSLRHTPYVLTVWDLCHRDHPEFPEVGDAGEYLRREAYYRTAINRSYLTVCDSNDLCQRIARCYGTEHDRLIAMPLDAGWFMRQGPGTPQGLTNRPTQVPRDYIFYPAQLWPHKNHIRILEAIATLNDRGRRVHAVFCGSDRGNKAHVERVATDLGVHDQVTLPGFVNEDTMRALYLGSRALVMPGYFGPTNIPPLEAWACHRPVICSRSMEGQVGNAALCVDPDSTSELADAIASIYDQPSLVDTLVANGVVRLQQVESERRVAEATLLTKLEAFRARQACWGERWASKKR